MDMEHRFHGYILPRSVFIYEQEVRIGAGSCARHTRRIRDAYCQQLRNRIYIYNSIRGCLIFLPLNTKCVSFLLLKSQLRPAMFPFPQGRRMRERHCRVFKNVASSL